MQGDCSPLKQFLSRTPFFGGLDDRGMDLIVAMLQERIVPAGSAVVCEGDSGKSMYIVRSGCLHVVRKGAAGNTVKLQLMHAGDFFGVTSLIEMEPRPFSVIADQQALLLELTNMDLYKLYRQDLKTYVLVLQNISRELCRHLRKAATRIATLMDAPCALPAAAAKADASKA